MSRLYTIKKLSDKTSISSTYMNGFIHVLEALGHAKMAGKTVRPEKAKGRVSSLYEISPEALKILGIND